MQILINGWTGLLGGRRPLVLGVPNAGLWGALTLVLRFIPYIGVWMAAAMPLALSFAVFDDWTRPLMVFGLFAVLELFSYSVLEPWLYGSHTGVSPVALLLAAAFWTWLWGFAGLFLAIPMTVCVVVMGKYIPQLKFLRCCSGMSRCWSRTSGCISGCSRAIGTRPTACCRMHCAENSMLEVCDAHHRPGDAAGGRGSRPRHAQRCEAPDGAGAHQSSGCEEQLDSLDISRPGIGSFADPREQGAIVCVPAADRADEIIGQASGSGAAGKVSSEYASSRPTDRGAMRSGQ